MRGLAALGFAGANVTAPHKLAVARLDVVETDAPSVNTLRVVDGRIEGWTTDAAVLDELEREAARDLGDGGVGHGVHARVQEAGLDVQQFSRRGEWPPDVERRRPRRQRDVGARRGARRAARGPDARRPAVSRRPRRPRRRVPRARRSYDGLDVLVAQGAASFELWTGVPAPVDVMRNAVRSAP